MEGSTTGGQVGASSGAPVLNPFDHQTPTEASVEKIKSVREGLKTMHQFLIDTLPVGREKVLAITKLEEVSMWANKAIVFHQ